MAVCSRLRGSNPCTNMADTATSNLDTVDYGEAASDATVPSIALMRVSLTETVGSAAMIPVPVPVIDAADDQQAPNGTVSVPCRTVTPLVQAATMDAEAAGGKYGDESSNKREGDESGTNGDGTKDKKDYDEKEGGNDGPKLVGFGKLFFKYATGQEMLYMFLGTLFAVVSG